MDNKEMKDRIIKDKRIAKDQMKACLKLMKMAKEAGIKEEGKKIIKKFKFELDNNIVSYHTFEKLKLLEKEIGSL